MYGNEAGRRRGDRRLGIARDELYVTTKLNNGFHRPDDARRAFDESLAQARPGPGRPVPHPLAAPDPVRRRLRLHLADARRVPEGRPRHLDRRLQLPARPPRPDRRGDRRRAGREPGRGAPVLRQRGRPRRERPARRSPSRPGPRSRRARSTTTPRSRPSPPGSGVRRPRSPLRWHVQRGDIVFPKSMRAERMARELRDLRLRAQRRGHGRDHRPRPRRGGPPGPEPGRVRLHPRLIAESAQFPD